MFTKKQTQVQFGNNTAQKKEQEEQFQDAHLITSPRLALLGAKGELPDLTEFSPGKRATSGKAASSLRLSGLCVKTPLWFHSTQSGVVRCPKAARNRIKAEATGISHVAGVAHNDHRQQLPDACSAIWFLPTASAPRASTGLAGPRRHCKHLWLSSLWKSPQDSARLFCGTLQFLSRRKPMVGTTCADPGGFCLQRKLLKFSQRLQTPATCVCSPPSQLALVEPPSRSSGTQTWWDPQVGPHHRAHAHGEHLPPRESRAHSRAHSCQVPGSGGIPSQASIASRAPTACAPVQLC